MHGLLTNKNRRMFHSINRQRKTLVFIWQLVNGEMTASISFLVRTSRPVRDEMVTNDYVLNMDRIRGRFSITIIAKDDLMIV